METLDTKIRHRLPRAGESVKIKGLVSASDLNGKSGKVVSYEKEARRYRIKLHVGSKPKTRQLAVKPENIALLVANNEKDDKEWNDRLVHVFVPCHTSDERRQEKFRQCVKSLVVQQARCRVFVGISGDTEDLRQKAMDALRAAATMPEKFGSNHQWYAYEVPGSRSQFQHFRALMSISMAVYPSAWLMFLDNDDMYHALRILFFQTQANRYKDNLQVDGFYSGGKLLIDEIKVREKFGNGVPQLEHFIDFDPILDGIVTVAATQEENEEQDVQEYFDFCVRSSVMKRFLSLTPDGILAHKFCDVRFSVCVSGLNIQKTFHPEQEWLLMHYRMRLHDRHEAFLRLDTTAHQNAMMAVHVSQQDKNLSDKTGLSPIKIAFIRKDIEEGAIQFIEWYSVGLEHKRKNLVSNMDRDFGSNIGSLLWEETCNKFSDYFSGDLAKKNRQWCDASIRRYNFHLEDGSENDKFF